jgi:hypothetical protein
VAAELHHGNLPYRTVTEHKTAYSDIWLLNAFHKTLPTQRGAGANRREPLLGAFRRMENGNSLPWDPRLTWSVETNDALPPNGLCNCPAPDGRIQHKNLYLSCTLLPGIIS